MSMDLKETGCARAWTGLIWLRIGTSGGLFRTRLKKHFSIKRGEFLEYLNNCVAAS